MDSIDHNNHDDESTTTNLDISMDGEFSELDREVRRMTRDADALLDSIRQDDWSSTTPSSGRLASNSQRRTPRSSLLSTPPRRSLRQHLEESSHTASGGRLRRRHHQADSEPLLESSSAASISPSVPSQPDEISAETRGGERAFRRGELRPTEDEDEHDRLTDDHDYDEDDDMLREEKQLEMVTAALRDSLDGKNQVPDFSPLTPPSLLGEDPHDQAEETTRPTNPATTLVRRRDTTQSTHKSTLLMSATPGASTTTPVRKIGTSSTLATQNNLPVDSQRYRWYQFLVVACALVWTLVVLMLRSKLIDPSTGIMQLSLLGL